MWPTPQHHVSQLQEWQNNTEQKRKGLVHTIMYKANKPGWETALGIYKLLPRTALSTLCIYLVNALPFILLGYFGMKALLSNAVWGRSLPLDTFLCHIFQFSKMKRTLIFSLKNVLGKYSSFRRHTQWVSKFLAKCLSLKSVGWKQLLHYYYLS